MKKSGSKKTERKAQREAKAVQQHKTAQRLAALAEREANSLRRRCCIDLGDRSSSFPALSGFPAYHPLGPVAVPTEVPL